MMIRMGERSEIFQSFRSPRLINSLRVAEDCHLDRKGALNYLSLYRTELLAAIQSIELDRVNRAIDVFVEARAHNHSIFVCGNGTAGSMAAEFLCDLAKGAKLRVLPLVDESPDWRTDPRGVTREGEGFVQQLKNLAGVGDVVVGVSSSSNASSLVRAFEYASRIGCRTVAITGSTGGKLETAADAHILVPTSHPGSTADYLIIICHMIGYYLLNSERVA